MIFLSSPQLLGYPATKVCVVVIAVLLFIRTCVAEELHGRKQERHERGVRIWVLVFCLFLLSAAAFLMCGVLENNRRGQVANFHSIWDASLFWKVSEPVPGPPPAMSDKPSLEASFFTLDPKSTPLREITVVHPIKLDTRGRV